MEKKRDIKVNDLFLSGGKQGTKRQVPKNKLAVLNEKQIAAAEKRQSLNSIRSHELKNPLNVILGYLESLSDEIYGEVNKQQRNTLNIIKEAAYTQLDILNKMTVIDKVDSGIINPIFINTDLKALLKAAEAKYSKKIASKNITLDYSLKFIKDDILLDAENLISAFSEIIGYLILETDNNTLIEVEAVNKNNEVIILFKNKREGFESENVEDIYNFFLQNSNYQKTLVTKFGFGIYYAVHLLKICNASISVQSSVKYNKFIIRIPLLS